MPQHDNTVLESDSRPSVRPVQALLYGSSTCILQQSRDDYPRERSPAATGVPILQGPSDREFDAQALVSSTGEARRPAAFALEDKPVLTSGNSSTPKRSDHGTDKCPGCGADVRPSPKRQLKRLSARQQRAFCEAHKLKAAKTEWALRKYPRIRWRRLDARLQKFSPALRAILNGAIPSFYRSELKSAVTRKVNP
jgi:hypothetical protein